MARKPWAYVQEKDKGRCSQALVAVEPACIPTPRCLKGTIAELQEVKDLRPGLISSANPAAPATGSKSSGRSRMQFTSSPQRLARSWTHALRPRSTEPTLAISVQFSWVTPSVARAHTRDNCSAVSSSLTAKKGTGGEFPRKVHREVSATGHER